MEDFIIQNFRFGLDARRSELTSQPGTLATCQDAHINGGAEVEKRAGFFPLTTSGQLDLTFGLEAAYNALYTFGDDNSLSTLDLNLGNGIHCLGQKLVNPDGSGANYAMQSVIFSYNYNGKPIVVANFKDGIGLTAAIYYVNGTNPTSVLWNNPLIVTNGIAFGTRSWLSFVNTNSSYTSGSNVNFSDIGDATKIKPGTLSGDGGFLAPAVNDQTPSDCLGFLPYQGKLALFNRRSIQIWAASGAATTFSLLQTLANIGTCAPFSLQALGDLDCLFVYDNGIRSLRVRDSSNNAYVTDLGSPIDSLIVDNLAQLSSTQLKGICSVVEPSQNRYWVYIPDVSGTASLGKIYVLSYYPTLKIVAWSTYTPCYYSSGQKFFTPTKMVVYNGRVFIRGTSAADGKDYIFGYGYDGTHLTTQYDQVPAIVETPWLDAKQPSMIKTALGIDVGMTAAWTIQAGMAPRQQTSANLPTVYTPSANYQDATQDSTFDIGSIRMSGVGTHFKLMATSVVAGPATLSSLVFKYNRNNKQ